MAGLPANLSFADLASVLTATADLKLVQSIRSAMLAADIASGRMQPVSGLGPAPSPPPAKRDCCDCYCPAEKIDTPPVYLPRKRIQLSPLYVPAEPRGPREGPRGFPVPPPEALPEVQPEPKFIVQPPWKSVPWKNPLPPIERPKVIVRVIDKIRRGQMIDLFI